MALLKSQLAYCFGINISPQQNPIQVEGMWFGIGRYNADSEEYGAWEWLFSLLVPCKQCQTLRPGRVFKIVDWDERKASAQRRFQEDKRHPTIGPRYSCWEEAAISITGLKGKNKNQMRQLWINSLTDYQTNKKRELALYLRQVEDGCNRYYGKCPGCGAYQQI